MQIGDLVYDEHYAQTGIILDVTGRAGDTIFVTLLYENGDIENSARNTDFDRGDIRIISESR
tara:strand:+ start:3388 stop:3573 length:186 start_codon:yes stop_codon:yes gene_type:complete